MESVALGELAQRKGALSAALSENPIIEVDDGTESIAFLVNPQALQVLLAMIDDLQKPRDDTNQSEPGESTTVSCDDLISSLQ